MANDVNEPAAARATTPKVRILAQLSHYLHANDTNMRVTSLARTTSNKPASSAPSGIAQLRKSVDANQENMPQRQSEAMNLDDFIFPSSVASPAGLSPSPSAEKMASEHATAPAINIKRSDKSGDEVPVSRASAPSEAPALDLTGEFNYVQRRVRKTSIDERRVRCSLALTIPSWC